MNLPNGWELILVLLVVVLVFGSKRLPDSARALGRSMRILKAETKGLREDDAPPTGTTTAAVAQPVHPQPVHTQPVQPVQAEAPQAYQGQQLFDAQGRPVQVPLGSQPMAQPVSQPAPPASSSPAGSTPV